MEDGLIPVEETMRQPPASTLTPAMARGPGMSHGIPRGSRVKAGAHRGGESRVQEGVSKPAGREGQGRGGHRGQGRAVAGPSAGESLAYAEMEGMSSSWHQPQPQPSIYLAIKVDGGTV